MSREDQISLKPTTWDVTKLNAWLDENVARSDIEPSLAADLKLVLNETMANLIC